MLPGTANGNEKMRVVLLRVGIDTGCGGIHGPLFANGSFDFLPIPDRFRGNGIDKRTDRTLPERMGVGSSIIFRRVVGRESPVNPFISILSLIRSHTAIRLPRRRHCADWITGASSCFTQDSRVGDFDCPPALYIIGFFEVDRAGLANSFSRAELAGMFQNNFHVMHEDVFQDQKDRLVLVRGNANSRLLRNAVKISALGKDKNGSALHRLAPEMQTVFGGFEGKTSIQRSPPRWVAPEFTQRATRFVLGLK